MIVSAARAVCREAVCSVLPHPSNAYRPYALRHPILAFINTLLMVVTLGGSLALSLTPEIARLSTVTAPTVVRLTNAERVKAKLPVLKEDPLLKRSAQLKGEHMLRHDYFEHTSPDGLSPWVWFDRASYTYTYAGENLAIDFSEAEDVVAAWMRSASHRRNLLSDRYVDTGIAAVTGEFQGRTATIVVQHFGARRAAPQTARTAQGTPAVAQAATSPPTPTPRSLSEVGPSPLTAPSIAEPAAGTVIGGGPVTVRGTAPAGSTVDVVLGGKTVGTYQATDGAFSGTFVPPTDEERSAALTAIATSNGRKSRVSSPINIRLDTKAPAIVAERVLMLPDPLGVPRTVLLAVAVPDEVVRVTVEGIGAAPQLLARQGTVASGRFALTTENPVSIRATDARGNTRTVTLEPFLPYVTAAEGTDAPRARVAAAVSRLRPALVGLLAALAALLGVNILAHLRLHRLLHPDLLAHAGFVLALGTTLVLFA